MAAFLQSKLMMNALVPKVNPNATFSDVTAVPQPDEFHALHEAYLYLDDLEANKGELALEPSTGLTVEAEENVTTGYAW